MSATVERAVERILIVNDNGESVADTLSEVLVREARNAGAGNYEVVASVDQNEGLEKYMGRAEEKKPFDAILTNLPEFAAKIRALDEKSSGRRTVIIGTTGGRFEERDERVFDTIIELPCKADTLKEIVRNCLDSRRPGREGIPAPALQGGAPAQTSGKIRGTA